MANDNTSVPQDLKIDLNTYVNKYADDDSSNDNPLTLLNIESAYFDMEQLGSYLHNIDTNDTTFEYTSMHLNIQSLPAKFDALKLLIHELREKHIVLDFIMLCETFLRDDIVHHFDIPDYSLVYQNRPNSSRGGVAIYISKQFNYKKREDLSINVPGTFESIFIEIETNKSKAVIGEIYRVPNTNETNSINMYENIIKKLNDYKNTIIIGTDQNFDYIKINHHNNTESLLGIFLANGLIPTITKPTRITHSTATLIDNIYISVNNKSNVKSAILCADISDHLPVITCVGKNKRVNNNKPVLIKTRPITQQTTQHIADLIKHTDWNYLEHMNTDDAYAEFDHVLNNIINNAAPEKIKKIPASFVIRDPWMTRGLATSSRTLIKLNKKKLGKHKTHPHFTKYILYRNIYNRLKRVTKHNYYDELLHKYQFNTRKTWGVINTLIGRTSDKSSISDTFKINNSSVNDPDEIANEFCHFFTNIGKKYANDIPNSKYSHNHYLQNKVKINMFMAPTDPHEVVKLIDTLKRKNSCGHDNISSALIKDIKYDIAFPLAILFNKSLNNGKVPDQIKLAKVIPIYKAKDKELFNNYRPISLLPTTSKILEKIVHKRLYHFLLSQLVFYNSQYGFRPQHSTIHAVNEFVDDTIESFDNNKLTLSVFLDLSKAFDTIDHKILLNKLEWYGVRGVALEWFKSYLEQRKQYVQYKNSKSTTEIIPCGVPQGSVLGPLLFIIYTNDLPNCLSYSKAILFADDTTVYLSSSNIQYLYRSVNLDLESMAEWFRANKLSLNVGKTHLVVFKQCHTQIPENLNIKIGNEIIERKNVVKFLGIYIDSKLEWHDHIKYIKNKLNSSLYAMRKTKHLLKKNHLLTLYYALIYPYLDYGITLWGSTHTSYVNTLFIKQKKAIRIITGAKYNEHTNPLFKELNLLKLNDLYELKVSKYMYSLIKRTLPGPIMKIITNNSLIHSHNTRNRENPHINTRRTNIAAKSLRHKGPEIWYKIPNKIKLIKTINSFSKQIKNIVIDKY